MKKIYDCCVHAVSVPNKQLIFSFFLLLSASSFAQKTWTGLAGDGQWASPTNWSGNIAPLPTDNVLLNNANVSGSYTVTLPAGTVTTTINQLTITPTGANVITLVLPATNTGVPGFKVGDGVAGNYDIVLNTGAILKNASGATSGNGIEGGSLTLDSLRINNGARYLHNSTRSVAGVISIIAKVPGTETGIFEYDTPSLTSTSITASGRTYGTLMLTRTAGAATYTASGGSALTVRGNLVINPGVTLNSTMTGALNLAGDFTNNGVAFSTTQVINFNGSVPQNISGTGTFAFATPASITIATGSTAATSVVLTVNGTVAVNGAFQINQGGYASGSGAWTYTNGKLIFNNTSGSYGINSEVFWPTTNGPTDVNNAGTGGITLNVPRIVPGIFQTSSGVTNGGNFTFNGTAMINTGGYFTGSPFYGNASTLVYNTGGNYGRGQEWNATSGAGYPNSVQVSNGTSLDVGSGSAGTALQMGGNLTVDAGSGFYMDFGGNNMTQPINVLGSLILNGNLSLSGLAGGDFILKGNWTHNSGFFTPKNRAVFFNAASGDQTITNPFGETFDYAIVDKAAGNLVLANNATINQLLTLTNALINTGTNKIYITSTGSIARTNGWVNGNLQKNIALGATNANFEIGDALKYTPVTVSFGSVTTAGDLLAKTTPGDHPQIASSGLNPSRTANRYWTVTNTGIVFTTYSATFNFVPADLEPTADPNSFVVAKYSGATWTLPTTGTRTATSTQAAGLTAFSDFQLGNFSPLPLGLEYFRGSRQSTGTILDWKASCGANPYIAITLERGNDGIHYSSINTLTASAARCEQPFNYTDLSLPGLNYYRLKIVDEQGSVTYSTIVTILNKESGFAIINLVPSIVTSSAVLNITAASSANFQLIISDMKGMVVQQVAYGLQPGNNQLNLHLDKLPAGVYVIKGISNDVNSGSVRFVKE